jgi:hypothetical protein
MMLLVASFPVPCLLIDVHLYKTPTRRAHAKLMMQMISAAVERGLSLVEQVHMQAAWSAIVRYSKPACLVVVRIRFE